MGVADRHDPCVDEAQEEIEQQPADHRERGDCVDQPFGQEMAGFCTGVFRRALTGVESWLAAAVILPPQARCGP